MEHLALGKDTVVLEIGSCCLAAAHSFGQDKGLETPSYNRESMMTSSGTFLPAGSKRVRLQSKLHVLIVALRCSSSEPPPSAPLQANLDSPTFSGDTMNQMILVLNCFEGTRQFRLTIW